MADEREIHDGQRIVVKKDGPYFVLGNIPLVRKIQIVSEYGEPLAWKTEGPLETHENYSLCRCGQSHHAPFCDGTHRTTGFDGTESADTNNFADRSEVYPGGKGIVVRHDDALCMNAGFCANRKGDIREWVLRTGDTSARSQVIAMIERCPSGSLTYSMHAGEADVEPDLPRQIAVVTEITSTGPIEGCLWVTGGIPVERADGLRLETRNRVTLCGCGRSRNKPLCDGTHRPEDTQPSHKP
jgi:CDGSH-type Zn-finger protein